VKLKKVFCTTKLPPLCHLRLSKITHISIVQDFSASLSFAPLRETKIHTLNQQRQKSHKACCLKEISDIFEYYGKIFSLCSGPVPS
jgi:hypothetical protein